MSHEASNVCCGESKLCSLCCCPCGLDIEMIKSLVNKPEYICKSCGRAANEEKNLCQPVRVD